MLTEITQNLTKNKNKKKRQKNLKIIFTSRPRREFSVSKYRTRSM